jgi:hypothetical protein
MTPAVNNKCFKMAVAMDGIALIYQNKENEIG